MSKIFTFLWRTLHNVQVLITDWSETVKVLFAFKVNQSKLMLLDTDFSQNIDQLKLTQSLLSFHNTQAIKPVRNWIIGCTCIVSIHVAILLVHFHICFWHKQNYTASACLHIHHLELDAQLYSQVSLFLSVHTYGHVEHSSGQFPERVLTSCVWYTCLIHTCMVEACVARDTHFDAFIALHY